MEAIPLREPFQDATEIGAQPALRSAHPGQSTEGQCRSVVLNVLQVYTLPIVINPTNTIH